MQVPKHIIFMFVVYYFILFAHFGASDASPQTRTVHKYQNDMKQPATQSMDEIVCLLTVIVMQNVLKYCKPLDRDELDIPVYFAPCLDQIEAT